MKKISFLVSLLVALIIPGLALAFDNLIYNGSFSNGLDHWSFSDISFRNNCSGYYAEAHADDGRAVLHGHSCTSEGMLTQVLSTRVKPAYFAADFNLEGGCSNYNLDIFDTNGERVLCFGSQIDSSSTSNTGTSILFYRNTVWDRPGKFVKSGTFEIYFDYGAMKATAYLNGSYLTSFTISSFTAASVGFRVHHNCQDGRDDAYLYIDNVKIR
jgi:hypothetical protein